MVLFLLRSARSPWNLLRCGRRWTTSSSADCACQMQLPKAFVFRQLIFGINANPHYKSSAAPPFATRCGRVEASLRSVVRILPAIRRRWIYCRFCDPCAFLCGSQVCLGAGRMSSDARRINVRGSAPAKLWDRVVICAAIAARGLARRLRRARVSALPVTQLESAPPRSFAGAFSLFFRRHS